MKMSPGRSFHLQPVEDRRRKIIPDRRRKPPKRMSDFPISEKAFIAIKILTSQPLPVKKRFKQVNY
jgi:hypothetical protein